MNYFFLRILFLSLSLLAGIKSRAQSIQEQVKIPTTSDFFEVDDLGYIYTVEKGVIKRYDSSGKLKFTYTNLSLGDVSILDVSNTFNILVFYDEQLQVVFLDNTLSAKSGGFSLIDLGYSYRVLICSSKNNGFWLYDPQFFKLYKYDNTLKVIAESFFINEICKKPENIFSISEYHNKVYLADSTYGVYVFDNFGGFIKKIPLVNGFKSYFMDAKKLYYGDNNNWQQYDIVLSSMSKLNLPFNSKNTQDLRIVGNTIYTKEQNMIKAYKIK